MNTFSISWKNIKASLLTAGLNIILTAFGTGIITILMLASSQINDNLDENAKNIDLVVGAKGSPLQLILSSVFYIDFPTGNIPLKDAEAIAHDPMVKTAVPLALGDNFNGFRIAGTDPKFIKLYGLELATGRFWKSDFEVTIGNTVASSQHLKVGDRFFGAHGLTGNGDIHRDHAYIVTGILRPHNDVTDNLVLTNIASVWRMHEGEEPAGNNDGQPEPYESGEREITSLLIQYRSPLAIVMFPRMVNGSTNLQAASPAMESARLFSLIGIGLDTLSWLAFLIICISMISVFISLINSLKERKYDLAVMRTLGASQFKIFLIILLEGIMLTTAGTLVGILLGHIGVELIGHYQTTTQARLSGMQLVHQEMYLLAIGVGVGLISGIVPAIQAYRSNISRILAKA